eukprot:4814183-Amphidinium_carterae.1
MDAKQHVASLLETIAVSARIHRDKLVGSQTMHSSSYLQSSASLYAWLLRQCNKCFAGINPIVLVPDDTQFASNKDVLELPFWLIVAWRNHRAWKRVFLRGTTIGSGPKIPRKPTPKSITETSKV